MFIQEKFNPVLGLQVPYYLYLPGGKESILPSRLIHINRNLLQVGKGLRQQVMVIRVFINVYNVNPAG